MNLYTYLKEPMMSAQPLSDDFSNGYNAQLRREYYLGAVKKKK